MPNSINDKYNFMNKKNLVLLTALLASLTFLFACNKSEAYTASNTAEKKDLNKPMSASKHLNSIVLGAGCFWGAEKRYEAISGVVDAVSGYADGVGVKPTYREITQRRHKNNPNNHAEVVKVTYNASQIGLEDILRKYFETHDPTQINGQGNDIGTQYRSTILTSNTEQTTKAHTVLKQYQTRLNAKGYGKIVTKIKPLTTFFPAEDYHQDYLLKNPKGYCPDHATGVKFVDTPRKQTVNNSALLKGAHIVVIDSADYCPFCEKFKKDVVSQYEKSTPISFRKANELKGLNVKTATWATPTILFMKDGEEVFGHQGYMSPDKFYETHSRLKFL